MPEVDRNHKCSLDIVLHQVTLAVQKEEELGHLVKAMMDRYLVKQSAQQEVLKASVDQR